MTQNLHAYDTFDYPTDHTLYSKKNAKLLRKMKDECSGSGAARICRSASQNVFDSASKQ